MKVGCINRKLKTEWIQINPLTYKNKWNFQTKRKNQIKKTSICPWLCWLWLTLLIAERLLQHGQDDRVVQHKVAEVAKSRCTQSGVANQRVFIQKTAGGGRPTGGGESAQHLHDTGGHRHRRTSVSRPQTTTTQQLTLISHQVTVTRKAPKPKCYKTQRYDFDIVLSGVSLG